jgi:hypothetical protein
LANGFQVAAPGGDLFTPERQSARIIGGTRAPRIGPNDQGRQGRQPQLMAFLAHLAQGGIEVPAPGINGLEVIGLVAQDFRQFSITEARIGATATLS